MACMICSSSSSPGTGQTGLVTDYSRVFHPLGSELLADFMLLRRGGDAQHLQMASYGVLPKLRLLQIVLATERTDKAPRACPLKVLDPSCQKMGLFAHDYTGCQQTKVS